MTYALLHREPVGDAARRLLLEQIEGARDDLRVADPAAHAGDDERGAAVHSARKHLKRARSVLRLVRGGLPGKAHRRLARLLRDAGRGLSDLRDAQVMVETLESLADEVGTAVVGRVRPDLQARLTGPGSAAGGAPGGLAHVEALLRKAHDAAGAVHFRGDGAAVLDEGLRRIQRAARERLAGVLEEPSPERLHEWRKRVKDSWYHRSLLAPAWADVLGAEEDAAHRLSEQLGADHDLAVLGDHVLQLSPNGDVGVHDVLLAAIDRRRARLQRDALVLGRRLYAEAPGTFAGRLVGVWRVWGEDEPASRADAVIDEPTIPAPAPGSVEPPSTAPPTPGPRADTRLPAPAPGTVERTVADGVEPVGTPPRGGGGEAGARRRTSADAAASRRPMAEASPSAPAFVATPTGKRYHRPECALAGPGARPVSPPDLRALGLLPCTVCRPRAGS